MNYRDMHSDTVFLSLRDELVSGSETQQVGSHSRAREWNGHGNKVENGGIQYSLETLVICCTEVGYELRSVLTSELKMLSVMKRMLGLRSSYGELSP